MAFLANLRSTIAYQTTGSTISTGAIYTTLAGNIPAWSNQLTYSTLTGSTISTNSIAAASTLTGSSIILSGNMGIGTANPSQILEVYRNSGVGTITQMNITSWAGGNTTTNQSILNLRIQGAGGGTVDNTIIGQYHSSNTYGFAFNPFGVNVMNILGSGRVGIGTVNPQAILHIHESPVVGDVSRKEAIRGTRNGTGGVQNNVSMALSYGPNTIAVSPYGVIDFKVNGLPDADNGYGYIPNVTVMSVVGNGNVGIGTTDPATTLHVSGASSTYTNGQLFISDANYPGNQLRLFSYWGIQISTSFTTIQSMYDTTPNRLAINPNGGNVGIGITNPGQRLTVNANTQVAMAVITSDRNDVILIYGNKSGTSSQSFYIMPFRVGSTDLLVGQIFWDGSNVLYQSTSDYRLKENVVPMQHGLSRIIALKPVTYNWIEHKTAGEGFIAHEVQSVIPMAVSGEKDALDKDGKILPQGIDLSRIVVHLVSGMQEQQTIIQQQASTITSLESRLASLEQHLITAGIV